MARVITPADVPQPSGGSRYNERIARAWGVELEYLAGPWPYPSRNDLSRLDAILQHSGRQDARRQAPVLLDGLIGCAAPAVLTAARAAGTPVVLLLHLPLPAEVGLAPAEQARLARSEGASLQAAAAVACTSAWAARDLLRRYGQRDVVVAEPGTDPAPVAVGSQPAQLLTLATYSQRKNHALLVDALTEPRLLALPWSALWLGAESQPGERLRLARRVTAAGLGDRVRVEPPQAGTASQLHASDLLLLPSRAETYAMVVAEGVAAGIPAIVGAGTGAEETLRGTHPGNSIPGRALDCEDPLAWAATLHEWLTDDGLRQQWRASACERRGQRVGWESPARILSDAMAMVAA